jgi:dTDP-glucose 4,6-dehydratase
LPNLEITKQLLGLTGRDESHIEYVKDRAGHDRRYALNSQKLRTQLGWEPKTDFDDGLARTVEWYKTNQTWVDHCRSGAYQTYYQQQYVSR